jgi:membrane protease YdiL (CAAX protease family)
VPLAVFAIVTAVTIATSRGPSGGSGFVGIVLVGLFLAALAEEVLFRGLLLHGLTRRLGGRQAVLLGSALFSAGHLPSLLSVDLAASDIVISLVVLFGLGVLLCRIRVATGSIWFASGVHTLWNFVTIAVVASLPADGDVPMAFALIKLVPIVVGLRLAVGVARSPRPSDAIPPLPAFAPTLVPGAAVRPYTPVSPAAPATSPWAIRPRPDLPTLPPPPRPDP